MKVGPFTPLLGAHMFDKLTCINERPQPFSIYTADALWTEPHLSEQMLRNHLSQETAMASRRTDSIDRAIDWIDECYGIRNKSICDLGCGPGLYAQKLAERGALVHGIDFSPNSIQYAKNIAKSSGQAIVYEISDYLKCLFPKNQDIVMMIYYDLCALSPQQRDLIYKKVHASLRPGGVFLFDVLSKRAFQNKTEGVEFDFRYMDGFWSAEDYYAFMNSFVYENEYVTLDKYTIIEKNTTWSIFNWMQYFGESEIKNELKVAGFATFETHYSTPLGNGDEDQDSFLVAAHV